MLTFWKNLFEKEKGTLKISESGIETDGFITMPDGRKVLRESVDPIDLAEHDLVLKWKERDEWLNKVLCEYKAEKWEDIKAHVAASHEKYQVRDKDNHKRLTLRDLSGLTELVMESTIRKEVVTAKIAVAKSLFDQIVEELCAGNKNEQIRQLIELAKQHFTPDGKGQLGVQNAIKIMEMNIEHPRWKDVQNLIRESIRYTDTTDYSRTYVRKSKNDKKRMIVLNYSAIPISGKVEANDTGSV